MSEVVLFFPKLTNQNKESRLLPASVLMVAAPLVEKGYQVKIIDQRVDQNWQETLLDELKKEPLVVGFSALTGKQILYALEASKLVKNNSSALTVWGGVHASLLPEQTLENPYVDLVVIGEGEKTFLELIERLASRQSYEDMPGLGYKKEGRIFYAPQTDSLNLDDLPSLPYHLVDIEKYIAKESFATGKTARSIVLYTSRGCPHRCGFCYNQEFNKRRWRGKSAERVVEDVQKLIKDYQITSLEIEDDEFFVNLERARKICQLIIQKKIAIDVFTSCRVNYLMNMDDQYLKLLSQAGFKTLAFGIESGSPRILELIHKDITLDQVFKTIKRLKRVGINSKYYFMAGFPTEAINDLYLTTNLIQKMKQTDRRIRIPAWRVYTPYPGTDLYQLSIREGWQPPNSLGEWADYDFNTVRIPWVKGRKKRIIENVCFLIRYLELTPAKNRGLYFKLGRFYGKIVNWRWRHHFFGWLPEKYFIELTLRAKHFFKTRL
jgi:radical SAM superfamily enzyme YgiQ (UPF0313 family)